MKIWLVAFSASALLVGCFATLTPAAQAVKVQGGPPPPTCRFVSEVTGTGANRGAANIGALNQAAEKGATDVYNRRVGSLPNGQDFSTFDAYACTTASAPSAPAAAPAAASGFAGCGKDTDCKGDRICERGTCVNPPSK